ncbi:MAG: galactokinase family protein [Thermoproteota archaeon]
MKFLASAPGRIALFGEHMDWVRKYVIAAAIDMRIFMIASEKEGEKIEIYSFPPFKEFDSFNIKEPEIHEDSDLKYVGGVVKAFLLRNENIKPAILKLVKASEAIRLTKSNLEEEFVDLPIKKGLSSSAALSVVSAASIDIISNYSTNSEELEKIIRSERNLQKYAELAYIGERKILQINCGQMDQYASSFGGLVFIDNTTEPAKLQKIKVRRELPIVIGDTLQQKDTQRILAWLGERFKEREEKFMEGVKEITRIVLEAKKELEKEQVNLERIGELMNENQYYLKNYLKVSGDCPISKSKLDTLIEAALNAGAIGAKLSGSGGGGCMIALTKPNERETIAKAIQKAGGISYITRVSEHGLKLKLLNP